MSTDWLVRLLIVRRESLSKSTLSVKVEPKCSLQWYLGAHQNPQKNFLVAEQLWPKERYPMVLKKKIPIPILSSEKATSVLIFKIS